MGPPEQCIVPNSLIDYANEIGTCRFCDTFEWKKLKKGVSAAFVAFETSRTNYNKSMEHNNMRQTEARKVEAHKLYLELQHDCGIYWYLNYNYTTNEDERSHCELWLKEYDFWNADLKKGPIGPCNRNPRRLIVSSQTEQTPFVAGLLLLVLLAVFYFIFRRFSAAPKRVRA